MGANVTFYVEVEIPVRYTLVEVSALTEFDAVMEAEKMGYRPREPYKVSREWTRYEDQEKEYDN